MFRVSPRIPLKTTGFDAERSLACLNLKASFVSPSNYSCLRSTVYKLDNVWAM